MSNEYFTGNPVKLDISRSKYHVSPRWTGSWNIGKLVPIFATSSILPGDTFKMRISSAVRTMTPKTAIMDDMDMQIECYFVPHHLILSRNYMSPSTNDANRSWSAFIGAQDSLLNMPLPSSVELPRFSVQGGSGYAVGGLADCLGYPQLPSGSFSVNCLKALAYFSVWNDYFRDPNTMAPVTFSINSSNQIVPSAPEFTYNSTYPFVLSTYDLGPTCRYHGYFGSVLPWPQRNSSQVTLPLGSNAPVLIGSSLNAGTGNVLQFGLTEPVDTTNPTFVSFGDSVGTGATTGTLRAMETNGFENNDAKINRLNLYTDLSQATAATVNAFRFAVQAQRWYEQLARSGNREGEITYGMFGVRGNDEGLKRPEYLGGKRIPIMQSQVPATGNATVSGSGTASLGTVGAFSLTNDSDYYFTKSFTTWGTLMVVMTCRTRESFSNGVDKEDFRSDRFDFYWPQFANLGEEPIRNKYICVTGTASTDDAVFGYQEAWAEYRMFNDKVTGLLRPRKDLGYMTYANDFVDSSNNPTPPTLKGYLNAEGQQVNVDRTMQVASGTSGLTFYGQFQFDIDMVRPMPLYSIPGLVDHH